MASLMKNIKLYFCFLFLIFGPKYGYLDLSLVTSMLIIIYHFLKLKKAYIDKRIFYIICLLIFLILYTLVVSILNKNIDILFFGKLVRCVATFISTWIIINNNKNDNNRIIDILINVLLLHAFIVLISATIFVDLQNKLKIVTHFALPANSLRATGLTNGYDFAGVLCLIGLVLICLYPQKNVKFKFLKIIVFTISSLFTSRVNMIMLELIFIYLVLINQTIKKRHKFFILIFIIISILPVLGLFLYSTGNTNNFIIRFLLENPYFSNISKKIVYYYATSDISSSIAEHFDFSKLSNLQFFFGAMKDANQDPGYTQYIYSIGLIGLLLTLTIYFKILKSCLTINYNKGKIINYYRQIITIIICICFVLSFKNSYLLARHVTEVLAILYACYISENKKIGV